MQIRRFIYRALHRNREWFHYPNG